MGLIYKVKNEINKKHYIGQTNQEWPRRKQQHINNPGKTSAIDQAILKYGQKNFEWKIIDEADNQDVLNMLERLHISRYEASVEEWGYNIKEGGSNGRHSEETRKKISLTNRNRYYSEETRKKIGKVHKNKKISAEHKQKISEANKGKKITKEHKQKISEANKGKVHSIKTRKKSSKAQHGRGLFGFTGTYYFLKKQNPWKKVWICQIRYNGNNNYLGIFHDPLSANLIYNFVWNQIYTP